MVIMASPMEIRHVVSAKSFPRKHVHSYGLIVICEKTKECILVQRRHSAEFLLIMLGRYSYTELIISLEGITEEEAKVLTSVMYDQMKFITMFREFFDFGTDSDAVASYNRISSFRLQIEKKISLMKGAFGSLQWSWPKGRPHASETPLECAIREFMEEVEYDSLNGEMLDITHKTVLNTCNGKVLINTYWICIVQDKFELTEPTSNPEVLSRRWVAIDKIDEYLSF